MIVVAYACRGSGDFLADFGHYVVCVDKDEWKMAVLLVGLIAIYDPGLEHRVSGNVAAGRLKFTTDLAEGVKDADAVFIAVGTPSRRGDGHADLRYVHAAAEEIARAEIGRAHV